MYLTYSCQLYLPIRTESSYKTSRGYLVLQIYINIGDCFEEILNFQVWIEMESIRELEMDGITPDVRVYDIFQPTPVPLRELSAIAVSLEIWRCKTNEYRNNRKLKEFCSSGECISLKKMLPDLPSVIYTAIDKYVRRFGPSMENWLKEHHKRIFYTYYDLQNSVLEYFDGFVCDYTGAIDYLRTAGCMMYCDRFDENQKFVIACTYFFENDIRRLWPSVSKNMDLNCIDFSKSPQLYYWICYLRNELDKMPCARINGSIELLMLDALMPHNIPSMEYFWNRLPQQYGLRGAFCIFTHDKLSYTRFILQKLNDQQLEEFINERSYELISILFRNVWYDKELIWQVWMYIRKAINVDGFTKLVVKMLQNELYVDLYPFDTIKHRDPKHKIWLDLCCEIWISAQETLKRSAVVEITTNKMLFRFLPDHLHFVHPAAPKKFEFLSTFLSDATSTERRRFWFDCWEDLLERVGRCKDLAKIMKLCFENEDDIVQFKENVMAHSDSVRFYCRMLLFVTRFHVLNDFANFLWSDIQAARSFKQQMLRLAFLSEGSSGHNFDYTAIIRKTKEFNKFIEDAFANIDLSTDFKNQLTSLPETQRRLSLSTYSVSFDQLVEFIDTFVLEEKSLLEIKALIINELKEEAGFCQATRHEFSFTPLLSWCLGSQEEVAKFKETYL